MSDSTTSPRSPIAIVGVSALFPGSLDATGFWSDILAGKDLITDVPPSHWLIEDYYDPDPSVPDKTYAKRGAFLPNVDFDAMGWGVPPNIVPETDTSQLLALIVAQKVLEDASKGAPDTLDRSRTSVILGVTSGQELLGSMVSRLQRPVWTKALRESGMPESEVIEVCDRISSHYTDWKESTFPGLLGNVVAGRIANRLDLGGTNCVCDAACASTMSALSMAMNELQLGDSDLVITGGVDTMNDIFMFMCFSKTPALSMSGDCRPFSDQADGTMLGEGIGMVALKRLADAERDGDRIYAVIRGCGSSSDGRSKSVYAPVSEGQAQCLRRAYEQAGHGPETVELVEAHGTGTRAGDAAEFGGLLLAFEESGRGDRQWCQLGSVKSQIGHTKAAAGAAGLFKGVMALHQRVLPPTLKIERPNPALDLPASPFHLTTRARPWVRGSDHPRRASVSSFGFGGSNFHLALEEYRPSDDGERVAPRLRALPAELVVLHGDSSTDLAGKARQQATRAAEGSPENPKAHLQWLAHQSHATAGASHRLAVVASDDTDLATKLEQAARLIETRGETPFATPGGIHYGLGAPEGQVSFLFPGQGSQHLDMGAELAMHFDRALGPWNLAADLDWEGLHLHQVVFPITSFDEGGVEAQEQRLSATEWAQPAIGCTSLSMLRLLDALGLEPASVAGHSFGEVTALHAAGVLGARDFLAIARRRGELMAEAASEPGAMTAVEAPLEALEAKLEAWGIDVVPANHNTHDQVVLSGRTEAIEAAEAHLAEEGIKARRLNVSTGFHSSIVAGASEGLAEFLDGIDFAAPRLPVFANNTAAPYPEEPEAMRRQLAGQITHAVRFVETIEAMYAAGTRTFVEVGPRAVLSGLVGRILGDRAHRTIRLDRKGREGLLTFLEGLATLVADGHGLELAALWDGHAEPPNPEKRHRPKLSIPINGANYGKPYPPAGGAAEMPTPNPERPAPVVTPPAEPVAPVVTAPPSRPMVSSPGVAPAAAPTVAPAQVSHTGAAPAADPNWAQAWQETQRQTADAHSVYMDAMARSHTAFLHTIEQGFGALTGQAMAPQPMASQPVASQPMAPQPAPPQAVAPQPVAPQPPSPQPMAVTPAPVVPTPAPAAAQPAPAAVAETTAPAVDLHALMLQVVAEKTGYPTEMLDLDMQLEGDLGIDSIKRVEILSAVQEQAPGLPEVDTTVLAKLETLGQIVDHMQSSLGDASTTTAARATPAAATPTAAASSAPTVDLHALMLQVVAEKTGYPTEMLNLDMQLEGDLGIDSIKRVEILSAVQEQAPGLPEVDTTVLAKLETLGQIVDHMRGSLGDTPTTAPSASVAEPVASPAVEPTAGLGRFVLTCTEQPAPGLAMGGLLAGGRIAIRSEGTALAETLAATLRERGVDAEVVTDGPNALPPGVAGLIFLGGLRAVDSVDQAIAVNHEAFDAAQNFATAHGLAEGAPGLFVTVQDTGGTFGCELSNGTTTEPHRAWLAGLAGLARTVDQEWPGVAVKAIDLERAGRDAESLATAIADELLLGGPSLDVGLPADGRRLLLRSEPIPVRTDGTPALSDGDVVVASGGARGVTATTLIELAGEARLRFVLLGRTPLPEGSGEAAMDHDDLDEAGLKRLLMQRSLDRGEKPNPAEVGRAVQRILAAREIRATLQAIADRGSEACYLPVDVTDAAALTAALGEIRRTWGPVRAIVHGAGVIHDKLLVEKTREQFDRVFETKVAGLRALLDATTDDPLRVLCLFSSVAARCGNLGQCDYAMANEVLNKVAWAEARRRGPDCRVKSLGWGPWEGGMVSPQLKSHFESLGVPLIPLAVGARMLVDELASPQIDQVEMVLGGEPRPEALAPRSEAPSMMAEVLVDRQTHPYLRDHSIRGVPVIPVAFAIEWLSRAARAFKPGLRLVGLDQLEVLRGLRLENFDHGRKRLQVHTRLVSNTEGAVVAVELRDGEGAPCYRATARMVSDQGQPPSPSPVGSADLALESWGDQPIYDGEVLFHGPDFQMIHSIDGISDHGMSAEMGSVVDAGWPAPWCTDPLAVDGALQMAVLWCQRMLGGASLPTGIASLRTFTDGPVAGPLKGILEGRMAKGSRSVSDVVFQGPDGTVVAELRGIETHLLPKG